MSKTRIVEIVNNDSHNYGQILHPNDLMKTQEFGHQHIEQVTQDFLIQTDPMVVGCNRSLQGGTLQFNVAEGKIYFQGKQFTAAAAALTLNAAHASYARLDYIVASLGGDVPAETQMVPFQRIRTADEISDGVAYPPTQFSRATEKHNIATVQVRTGTPSASPQPPILQPTDTVLYVVTVPANATGLVSGNVNDTRNIAPNLTAVKSTVSQLQTENANQQTQINDALAYELLVRDFESSFGRSDSLKNILNEIASTLLVLKYRYPTIVTNDSKCPAAVVDDGGTWAIDILVGTVVQFGSRFVGITPEQFVDPALNARYEESVESPDYKPIFENQLDFRLVGDDDPVAGTAVVRFDAPATTKALYLIAETGELVLRSTITPSNANECLLMKIIRNGSDAPVVKRYINSRNAVAQYSGTYAFGNVNSRKFDNDLAIPTGVGAYDIYGERASDRTRYQLSTPGTYNFDSIVTIPDEMENGDKWHIRFFILSGL